MLRYCGWKLRYCHESLLYCDFARNQIARIFLSVFWYIIIRIIDTLRPVSLFWIIAWTPIGIRLKLFSCQCKESWVRALSFASWLYSSWNFLATGQISLKLSIVDTQLFGFAKIKTNLGRSCQLLGNHKLSIISWKKKQLWDLFQTHTVEPR